MVDAKLGGAGGNPAESVLVSGEHLRRIKTGDSTKRAQVARERRADGPYGGRYWE
jgi:hypothetical protein